MSEIGVGEGLPQKPIDAVKEDSLSGLRKLLEDLSAEEQEKAQFVAGLSRVEREALKISEKVHPLNRAIENVNFIETHVSPLVGELFRRSPGQALVLARGMPLLPPAVVFGESGEGYYNWTNKKLGIFWVGVSSNHQLTPETAPRFLQVSWDMGPSIIGDRPTIKNLANLSQSDIANKFIRFVNKKFN